MMGYRCEIHGPIPKGLTDELKRVSEAHSKGLWEEFLRAAHYLQREFPDLRFREEPFVYPDVRSSRLGYLFVEFDSEKGYLVFEDRD